MTSSLWHCKGVRKGTVRTIKEGSFPIKNCIFLATPLYIYNAALNLTLLGSSLNKLSLSDHDIPTLKELYLTALLILFFNFISIPVSLQNSLRAINLLLKIDSLVSILDKTEERDPIVNE